MFQRLEELHPLLKGVYMIQGVGLCSNVYAIDRGKLTLVDSGDGSSWNALKPSLDGLNLPIERVAQVVLTHAHPDHTGGLREILRYSSPKIFVHALDLRWLGLKSPLVSAVEDGDEINLGNAKLRVLHTPGHTAGSLCLYEKESKTLFSGDTVFPNGAFGRTDLPTGNERELVRSLRRLSRMEVSFLLAGHGDPVVGGAGKHVKAALEAALTFFGPRP